MAALRVQLQNFTLELESIFSYVYTINFFPEILWWESLYRKLTYLFIYLVVTSVFGLCSSLELEGRRWQANDLNKH